jgi:hypothetical protein
VGQMVAGEEWQGSRTFYKAGAKGRQDVKWQPVVARWSFKTRRFQSLIRYRGKAKWWGQGQKRKQTRRGARRAAATLGMVTPSGGSGDCSTAEGRR